MNEAHMSKVDLTIVYVLLNAADGRPTLSILSLIQFNNSTHEFMQTFHSNQYTTPVINMHTYQHTVLVFNDEPHWEDEAIFNPAWSGHWGLLVDFLMDLNVVTDIHYPIGFNAQDNYMCCVEPMMVRSLVHGGMGNADIIGTNVWFKWGSSPEV